MSQLPELVKLYIRQVLIGFGIAGVFVGLLVWLNVANLQHLLFNTSGGWLAAFLLFFFNGLVFAGVQFAITIMRMAEPEDKDQGGKRQHRQPRAGFQGVAIPVRNDTAAPPER